MGLSWTCSLLVAFMCGRTACTLVKDDIVKVCSYRDGKGKRRKPAWKDAPGGQQYQTSYNMTPGSFTPVLMSSKHVKELSTDSDVDHVVMPMKWGLVPRWYKEGITKMSSFNTSNCRGESMLEKATFKTPLQQGHRCVVVMDGFYEWKTTSSGKQPYFFYFQNSSIHGGKFDCLESHSKVKTEESVLKIKTENIERSIVKMEMKTDSFLESGSTSEIDKCKVSTQDIRQECFHDDKESEKKLISSDIDADLLNDESHVGHKLLTCAAVFDVWQPSKTSTPLYSYSVITVAASKDMSWCHHRMPAILSTDQEVCDWLDFSTIPLNKAQSLIQSKADCLNSHAVSKSMNNSHYKSPDCLKPIDLQKTQNEEKKLSGIGQLMMNWLKKRPSSTSSSMEGAATKISKN